MMFPILSMHFCLGSTNLQDRYKHAGLNLNPLSHSEADEHCPDFTLNRQQITC
jgi:hypothetical protein